LASYSYENGNRRAARKYVDELLILAPQHQGARQLLEFLDK